MVPSPASPTALLLTGALASLVTVTASIVAVIVQRQASRRRRDPAPPSQS